jgi:hypothetical protein
MRGLSSQSANGETPHTKTRHERHFASAPPVDELVVALSLLIVLKITRCCLRYACTTDGTRRNFELTRLPPRGLLYMGLER